MRTRNLYWEIVDWLRDTLQHTISSFSDAYDAAFNHYDSQPLFSITSRELELLKQVDYYSNYQIRNALARLCKQLSVEFGYQVVDSFEEIKAIREQAYCAFFLLGSSFLFCMNKLKELI